MFANAYQMKSTGNVFWDTIRAFARNLAFDDGQVGPPPTPTPTPSPTPPPPPPPDLDRP